MVYVYIIPFVRQAEWLNENLKIYDGDGDKIWWVICITPTVTLYHSYAFNSANIMKIRYDENMDLKHNTCSL